MLLNGSTLTHRKKIATLAGGCAPEASTLPPVTVSQFFFFQFRGQCSWFIPVSPNQKQRLLRETNFRFYWHFMYKEGTLSYIEKLCNWNQSLLYDYENKIILYLIIICWIFLHNAKHFHFKRQEKLNKTHICFGGHYYIFSCFRFLINFVGYWTNFSLYNLIYLVSWYHCLSFQNLKEKPFSLETWSFL